MSRLGDDCCCLSPHVLESLHVLRQLHLYLLLERRLVLDVSSQAVLLCTRMDMMQEVATIGVCKGFTAIVLRIEKVCVLTSWQLLHLQQLCC